MSAYAADGEGFKLGGGTILAARWKHRRSNDIDVLFHPDTKTSHFEVELGKALEQAGGVPLGWGEWSRIEFGENHLDLLKGEPTPAIGHKPALIDRSPVTPDERADPERQARVPGAGPAYPGRVRRRRLWNSRIRRASRSC